MAAADAKAVEGGVGRRQGDGIQLVSVAATHSTNPAGASIRRPTSGRDSAKLGWRTAKTDLALTMAFAYNTLTGNGIQDYRLLANRLFERLHHPRHHRQSLSVFQFHRAAQLQRHTDIFRQCVVPVHPHGGDQRQCQQRLVRRTGLSAQRGGPGGADGCRIYRISHQRRERIQHSVSVLDLHRECAAAHRSRRDVRRR